MQPCVFTKIGILSFSSGVVNLNLHTTTSVSCLFRLACSIYFSSQFREVHIVTLLVTVTGEGI